MNTQNDNHAPVSVDEPNDRLIDIALTEHVGGATPPDLSARILAVHSDTQAVQSEPKQVHDKAHPLRWFVAAVAATLLVATTTLLYVESKLDSRETSVAKIGAFRTAATVDSAIMQSKPANQQIATPQPPAIKTDDLQQLGESELVERTGREAASIEDKYVELYGPPTSDSGVTKTKGEKQPVPAEVAASSTPLLPAEQAPAAVTGFAMSGEPAVVAQGPNRRGPVAGPARILKDHGVPLGRTETFGVHETRSRAWRTEGGEQADYQHLDLGQPLADAKQPSSWGMPPQLATAPRVELGTAQDGTLDRYAYDARPEELAALRAKMPSEHYWKDLQERERLRDDQSGDRYTPVVENSFIKAEGGEAVSTFGIDVDTASYSNVRQFLLEMHQLPPANAVRIEELVNYFHYDYAAPKVDDKVPFAAHVEVAGCPWNAGHRLARIAVKGREMDRDKRPQSNLVFLVDVSGSMNEPAKLPLVKYGLEQLTKELGENDHIAIVVYAGNSGVALPSTSGAKQDVILAALQKLEAGGSTAGGAGIQLAYQIAEENFIKGGTNRVILCTDGDFNVGTTSTDELQKLVATKAKDTSVFISTLGFGRGNLNDAMMVAISDHGNGNYHYIDNRTEARRVLVEEMTGTLVTIAKDVKIQVEFNPAKVAAYRLIGYEKRMLKTEDFNNDKKDAGEIGAGHTVTALYEIVPAGKSVEASPAVDELKYQKTARQAEDEVLSKPVLKPGGTLNGSSELLTLKMRYKAPDGDTSQKLEWPATDGGNSFDKATEDFRFAAAVAGFGMLLRDSQFKGDLTFKEVVTIAENSLGHDEHGYRSEFSEMVREAQRLKRD